MRASGAARPGDAAQAGDGGDELGVKLRAARSTSAVVDCTGARARPGLGLGCGVVGGCGGG